MTLTVDAPSSPFATFQELELTHRYYLVPRQVLSDAKPGRLTLDLGTRSDEDKTPNNRADIAGDCHILAQASQFVVGVPVLSDLEQALGSDVADGFRGRGSHAAMVAALQRLIDAAARQRLIDESASA